MIGLRPHGGGWMQFAAILISAACIVGRQTVSAADDFDGSSYARNVSLDANVDIFWTIDSVAETIRVAVHAKTAAGWAGVGVSEMGGMEGADILYYETSTGNVSDAHSLVAGTPVIDECTQDWTLLSAEVGDGGLVFEAERALDTGDSQDWVFVDDTQDGASPTRLLAAWGDADLVSYHGDSFAKGEVVIFGEADEAAAAEPLAEIKESADTKYFDVTAKNFTIPADRTTYQDTCIPASELPSFEEYHAIGFEGLLQEDTAGYVHHLVLSGWYGPSDCGVACDEWLEELFGGDSSDSSYTGDSTVGADDGSDGGSSGSSSSPSFSTLEGFLEAYNITAPSFCDNYDFADIFAWAPGVSGVELPTDVGLLLGNTSTGFSSLNLETHYNNPNGDEGMIDSSGVRVYYTEELRPMNMGVIKLGDPGVDLAGETLPEGKSGFSFGCPSSCTEEHFEAEEVSVFYHFLHMHENGQLMRTRQYRTDSNGDEVLVHTAEVEYYSFLQAGGFSFTVNDSVTIQRGDRFETECYYNTALSSVDSASVTFGLGSEEEMCIDYVYYYPDQTVPNSGACGYTACGGELLETSELSADSDFNRTFGVVDTCTSSTAGEVGIDSSSSARPSSPGLGLLIMSMTASLALVGMASAPGAHLGWV